MLLSIMDSVYCTFIEYHRIPSLSILIKYYSGINKYYNETFESIVLICLYVTSENVCHGSLRNDHAFVVAAYEFLSCITHMS